MDRDRGCRLANQPRALLSALSGLLLVMAVAAPSRAGIPAAIPPAVADTDVPAASPAVPVHPALPVRDTEASSPYDVVAPTARDARQLREAHADAVRQDGFGARLDRWHDGLYLWVQNFTERTDRRFADKDEDLLPVPATPFRLGVESEFLNRGGNLKLDGKIDLDILLQLPNIEQRLRLFVTSDDLQESPSPLDRASSTLRAGLRLSPWSYLDFDVGLRLDFPDAAFASLRWQRVFQAGNWDIQPFSKVYLQTGDGFGVVGGINFDHWKNRWLLRSASYANWVRNDAATEWTQTLVLAHARELIRFGNYGPIVKGRDIARGSGVQLLASGERTSRVDVYEASYFFKQATRKRWLYWHIAPLVRWERDYNWKAEAGIRIGVDALFWDLTDR